MKGFVRLFGLLALAAGAAATAQPNLDQRPFEMVTLPPAAAEFPRPSLLEPGVAFWKRVFSDYSEYQSVIHSQDQAHKIYKVLDFRAEAARLGPASARRLQVAGEKKAKRELDALLKQVHLLRDSPSKMTPAEHDVYTMFADSTDPNRYKNAIGRFRAQRGLKEATGNALQVAGRYLPQMESIFQDEGLPVQLTRLPLVESSFNLEAYSKVGAAGLWQFMPSSARLYMRLDEAVDQRRDPWESTRAAALHLKEDYAELGSWPLAVTAYNHGRSGLARGLREVKGETLEDLLQRWDGRRFGFASRNFYAEFLAASDVERNYREHFGEIQLHEPLRFDTVQIGHYVAYDTLRRCAGTDEATFHALNPGFRPEVLDGRLYVPPSSNIRVPVGAAQAFRTAYDALRDDERFEQQRFYYVRYRVQRGDTLGSIARRYGVSLSTLKQANGTGNPRTLRVGQVLRIPPRGGAHLVKVATSKPAPAPAPADGAAAFLLHKVRPGQTLAAIAQQYRTTIAALRDMNGLNEAQVLYAGATLKVPAY